ncbi:vesicle coat component [Beauveria asiatica]|uniref:Vesicle coat component n=1 Tax=Beauveria asiatica TaxID=1069075 RepID=A0AAW0RLL1_9HYPO
MAVASRSLQWLCSLLMLLGVASALKFELPAHTGGESHRKERCIRNFVNRDTMVAVKSVVGGYKGDGMVVNIHIRDALGNAYGRPRDVVGENRVVFTSHSDASFDVCYENLFSGSHHPSPSVRDIELDVEIGADARDWSAVQANEKLKPVEAELRRIEEMTAEVVREMEYLRTREQKLRDTNESTNTRVKWFGIGTTWLLIGLWAWQIMYLRAYFRSKHLI